MTMLLPLAYCLSLAPFDDSCATANPTFLSSGIFSAGPVRSLGPTDSVDHFRMSVQAGTSAEFTLQFTHADANLDLRLWNHDCTVLLVSSLSTDDGEFVSWSNATNGPVEVVAEAFLASTVTSDVDYHFTTHGFFVTCDFDDIFEGNDSCGTAWPLPFADFANDDLNITPGDDDYFAFTLPPFRQQLVEVLYSPAVSDIDAQVIADDCVTIIETSSSPGWERVQLRNPGPAPKTIILRVYRAGSATGCSPYSLRRTAGPGVNFCTAEPNSTGDSALIDAFGSTSFANNDLRLAASPMPLDAFALFVFSTGQVQSPLGNGTLCVGPTIQRGPVLQASNDHVVWDVDYTQFAGSAVPFAVGSTYHFQLWYRDTPIGGVNFGLSDGYTVLLRP